jgi:hypothetical protein
MHIILSFIIFTFSIANLFSDPPIIFTSHRQILVIGCARSGSQYMTQLLKAQGLDVGHEQMGSAGCVSWLMTADTDTAPWGPLSRDYTFDHIFHQVRDPVKVIQSLYNNPPKATWEWISSIIPEIQMDDDNLTKCAKYWYYWNLKAEAKAEWTYCIENIDMLYQVFGKCLGLYFDPTVLQRIPKNMNSRGTPETPITWTELKQGLRRDLYKKVSSLAIEYGYTPNPVP